MTKDPFAAETRAEAAAGRYTKQVAAAFWKGFRARQEGAPRAGNPYPDLRTACGRITFSRSFRRAWFHGWKIGKERHR